MKRLTFPLSPVLVLLFLTVSCLAAVPGGIVINAISDEFNTATLNPMWGPGLRGMPDSLSIQNGILNFQSVDSGDGPYPSARDMICTYANQIGRSLNAAEKPSIVYWVWLPPFAEWPTGVNASGYSEWFGLRVTAYDPGLPIDSGLYWPGIYIANDDAGPCLIARVGDGYTNDVTIGRIAAPGWWTLGLAWNAEGRTEYYAAPGRVTLTPGNLLYTTPTSDVPDANRTFNQLDGTFLALRMTYPATNQLSPDWMVDAIRVYVQPPPSGTDFNGDVNPDYVLFNPSSLQTAIWYLNGPTHTASAYGPTIAAGYQLVGVGDFNLDGHPDYLLFNPSTLRTAIWYLDGVNHTASDYGPTLPAGWTIVGTGDFDGDGKLDYLIFNASTGQTGIWYLNGPTYVRGAYGPVLPTGWTIVGVADFNGDGKPDLVLFNAGTLQTAIWYMNNASHTGGAYGPTLPAGWVLQGVADLNGDGQPDFVLFNASTLQTAIWYLNGPTHTASVYGPTLAAGYNLIAP